MNKLTVIGGGLAGCEAAYAAANRGIEVELIEMKPAKKTAGAQKRLFGRACLLKFAESRTRRFGGGAFKGRNAQARLCLPCCGG